MIECNIKQGSPEWLELRKNRFCASDAPVIMGRSKYKTRAELLNEYVTGATKPVATHITTLFELGHKTEEAARDRINSVMGYNFQPATFVASLDGMEFVASLDGIFQDIIFEHKLWNRELAAYVKEAGTVPDTHVWQLHHQMMVCNANSALFVVSDGTDEKIVGCMVSRDPRAVKQLLAGWKLFQNDINNYKPTSYTPVAKSVPLDISNGIVKLTVKTDLRVLSHNLDTFKQNAREFIEQINTNPQTDSDFANAELGIKACKKAEESIKEARDSIISQSTDINLLFSTLDDIQSEVRQSRLKLEKAVKAKKEEIKRSIIEEAKRAIKAAGITEDHTEQLNDLVGSHRTAKTIKAAADSYVTTKRVEVASGTYQEIPTIQDLAGIIGYTQAKIVYEAIKLNNIRGVSLV